MSCWRTRHGGLGRPAQITEAASGNWLHEEARKWRPVTEAGWDHDQFAIYVWR
jgi:hypothetical protein